MTKYPIIDADGQEIDFGPETEHHLRLAVLLDGRPFSFGPDQEVSGRWLLVIHHENGQHHCDMHVSDADLSMSDNELKERILAPALWSLDGIAYPERAERFMSAIKVYAKPRFAA